jgi:hypothetical protein
LRKLRVHATIIRTRPKMKIWHSIFERTKELFLTPISSRRHWGVIALVALLFILVPQQYPIDWDLITGQLRHNWLVTYQDPNSVYPPWGLILMLPYYLMRPEAARVLSVVVIGWLSHRRGWSPSRFLALVMSPLFLVTMSKSNLDILVLVFPILLWESVQDTRWQSLGRGLALSLLLVKPQGAIFIWLYLLWTGRKEWKELIGPLLIVALVVIPMSAIGSPPLIVQWLHNISNPSPQNEFYWSINNISLSALLSPLLGVAVVCLSFFLVRAAMKWKGRLWRHEHTQAGLLMAAMFLSPYTSQQCFSSALAYVPSWGSFLVQIIVMIVAFKVTDYWASLALWALLISAAALFLYQPKGIPGERPRSSAHGCIGREIL